jgi:hypothetical protein
MRKEFDHEWSIGMDFEEDSHDIFESRIVCERLSKITTNSRCPAEVMIVRIQAYG